MGEGGSKGTGAPLTFWAIFTYRLRDTPAGAQTDTGNTQRAGNHSSAKTGERRLWHGAQRASATASFESLLCRIKTKINRTRETDEEQLKVNKFYSSERKKNGD